MKMISLNVGLPREVIWHGRSVTTGIYKEPVAGRVALRKLNLDGDRQAKNEWPGRELPMGMFGENFTLHGLLEEEVHLGDRFRVGSAEVVVTQPRLPCYKLGVRFGADDMVKRFLASGKGGFYLAVTREGEVGAGDEISVISRDANAVPIPEITRLYVLRRWGTEDLVSLRQAMQVAALPQTWKHYFRERMGKSSGQ